MTDDLDVISNWAKSWAVQFNSKKTKNIVFTRREREHPPVFFGINGEEVEKINIHCHLGITFQSSASWHTHIDIIYKKACSRLSVLRQVKHLLDRSSLIRIYYAFIRPILEYGDVIWGNCSQHETELLENIQIEAARIITGLRRNSSRQKLYIELGLETLENRRNKHKLILFYKILNGMTPAYLYELVQPYLPRQTPYTLRNENNTFHPPLARTSSYFNSFIPSTIRLWNSLPLSLQKSPSLGIFRSGLEKFYRTDDIFKPFNYGIRKLNISHCQLRNNASNLKSHLFNQFLSENTFCANCNHPVEDNKHFFFICPKYNDVRQILLDSINSIADNVDINIELLLFGNRLFSYDMNIAIFKSVQKYISDTQRFV